MLLAEELVWALSDDDIGGVKIYCDSSISEKVCKSFKEIFDGEWKNALEKAEAEYGELENREYMPVSIENREYGLFIYVGALSIKYCWGDFCDLEYGRIAFNNTLKAIKKQYPTIEYEGLIAFPWSDRRCGGIEQYEVFSNIVNRHNDMVYDSVGEALKTHLEGTHLWGHEDDPEMDDLFFVITGKLHHFENREEITEYIEDLGATVTGSISKKTTHLINNDPASSSSKNKKAKELGIPIITEDEFICRFGDPDEYDIDYEDDYFWVELYNQLCEGDEDTFAEVANCLYTYKQWIGLENMERAFNSIIDMLSEANPEIRESLKIIAKQILSGESLLVKSDNKETDTTGNLPDGYMEALEMVLMAEKLGAPKPKCGEVISAEEDFKIVIANAEAGDPDAKFTAGKYFIADHIEEEYNRAVAWIKEAAEQGVAEAIVYIENNKKMFE